MMGMFQIMIKGKRPAVSHSIESIYNSFFHIVSYMRVFFFIIKIQNIKTFFKKAMGIKGVGIIY